MTSLRSKAGKAIAWDLLGNYGGQLVAFAISILLARLLEPAEFGLVGMSMAFISILRIFMDMGFASALIQSKDNTSLTYSSVFYLNVIAGAVLAFIIFAIAPWVGAFYNSEKIVNLVKLLSITFFISSFNVVQSTILQKNLNFKLLTYRDLSSQVLAGLVAVVLAWNGLGVYALVLQQIMATLVRTILLWKVTDWRPRLEFSWLEIKKLGSFSFYLFATRASDQLIRQLDTLVVGKLFSPSTLGYFSRANTLNSFIYTNSVNSIVKVFFPVLSGIKNDDKRFTSIYLKLIEIISGLSVFLTGILFLCGEEIILTLFGQNWYPSVLIFKIIIIKGFTYPISLMIMNVFMAKGKTKENFLYGNLRKLLRFIPLFIALFWGFDEYLYALVLVNIFGWLLNNLFVARTFKITFYVQVKAVLPNLVFAVIVVLFLITLFDGERNFVYVVIQELIFIFAFTFWLYFSKSILFVETRYYLEKVKRKFMS